MSILQQWAGYVTGKHMKELLDLYDDSFYIKPTLYNQVVAGNKNQLEDYFKHFLGKNDIKEVEYFGTFQRQIGIDTSGNPLYLEMGSYRFHTTDNTYFDANFTFVHNLQKIIAHHSSHFNDDNQFFS